MPPKKRQTRNASPSKKAKKEDKEEQKVEKIKVQQEPPAKKGRATTISKPGKIIYLTFINFSV